MKVVTPDYTRIVKMESWNDGNENALIVIKGEIDLLEPRLF